MTKEEIERLKASILEFVNNTPEVLSVLYDADMMPEQMIGTTKEHSFWMIADYLCTLHSRIKSGN